METEIKEMLVLILNKLDGLESRQTEILLVVKAIEHFIDSRLRNGL
jgi:hypothetical protein